MLYGMSIVSFLNKLIKYAGGYCEAGAMPAGVVLNSSGEAVER